jgi:DNA-binding PadR family transcriptional regulator
MGEKPVKPENYNLKHRPFVILGLVSEKQHEGGCHAYDINQRIEERGMRNWTNIGVNVSLTTIYRVLDRLEKDGLVEYYTEEVDNRIRKMYKITEYGYDVLELRIYKVLYEYVGQNDRDFYVAFSMFPIMLPVVQEEVFTHSLEEMKLHKKELDVMLEGMLANFPKMPVNVTGLFIHPSKILQTNIEFLEMVLEEIKNKDVKMSSKTYSSKQVEEK